MSNDHAAAGRIASIDILRGVVILLMMLDHVRERFYMHTRTGDPMFDTIDADLYFTRYLTHLCAAVFIFLAGLSAWLYAHPRDDRYRSPSEFLFKRGLVIILIEIVFYYLVWADSFPSFMFLQVLFAIGVCMIGLSLACRLPLWLIGALGFSIVFGHHALVSVDFAAGGLGHVLWTILSEPGDLGQVGGLTINVSYPVLPWFGVILLGYFAGPLFAQSMPILSRRNALIGAGVACLALMLVLRGFNLYGETLPWSSQETASETIMAFLNFTKYPPSPNYLLITLGFGLLLLAGLDSVRGHSKLVRAVQDFGSVPMFMYVLHLYVLLVAYWLLFLIFGATHGERFGLSGVAWIWVGAALLALAHYPIAHAFASYKHREKRARAWLSYF
ncbi:MAG: heparan-alpha-glucosaminide N-acetyltransferase domain-containing protein [Gammaproteobacteria bacterium]|nr:heparan-alpha-glucosaminide N-acetyltransferase domain-containing protein [Gammaproteobacteria bacterium]MCY4278911.1 heparan-alpha-glucosaminide N-acetyltransferase domain-containing protein [Gammaproteobacteria bacterium]MCY4322418.1 heparan-alpha-glucosaminide N-acetyltransferase domain-containing protein [Gammaproteobacteria bacterium]